MLTCFSGNTDKLAVYLEEAKRFGIEVLPPDVNESRAKFFLVNWKIRYGLSAVKNVGDAAVQELLRVRGEGGPFQSPLDLCRRGGLTRTALESLIKCGALDRFGNTRASLLAGLDLLQNSARKSARNGRGLFDQEALALTEPRVDLAPLPEFPLDELLAMEREMLGFYVTGHPLDSIRALLEQAGATGLGMLAEANDGEKLTVGGMIKSIREIESKRGRMAFVALEDLEGEVEVTVFADLFKRAGSMLAAGEKVLVEGRVNTYNDQKKIIAGEIRSLTEAGGGAAEPHRNPPAAKGLRIRIAAEQATADRLEQIRSVLRAHPGEKPVRLHLHGADGRDRVIQVGPRFRVNITPELIQALSVANLEIDVETERDSVSPPA